MFKVFAIDPQFAHSSLQIGKHLLIFTSLKHLLDALFILGHVTELFPAICCSRQQQGIEHHILNKLFMKW